MEQKTKGVVPKWHGSLSDWLLVLGAVLFVALMGWVIYLGWTASWGATQNQSIVKCAEHCPTENQFDFHPILCRCR
ncbi:MAG: hypothetical protein WA087_02890 [Candidatus Saccharimonadales bacterium]